jgi:hypothetical protein
MDDDADNTNGMYNNNKRRFMDDEELKIGIGIWRRSVRGEGGGRQRKESLKDSYFNNTLAPSL